jgi:hypothetical protein
MTTFETAVNLEHSKYIEEGFEGALHLITNTIGVLTHIVEAIYTRPANDMTV